MTTTYFLLNDFLRPKMKFCLPKSRPKNLAKFLPRNVAHSFSLSSKNLTSILKRLSIPPHSAEARQIQDVLKGCEGGLAVEHRKCVTSLEDMVDFALVYTGSKNVGVYENEITVEGETEEFAVGRTKMVGRKVVVCHKDMFPHAVYYCHNLEGTMGFEASLLGLRKGVKGGKVMVACHSETSTWNPRHLAFQVLKIKPGEGTICHVIDDNSIMWASP
ncbi:unnamed protein product [Cuscuta campestris]|uniref:BURP domain-containing protein n=1 Tax=Cuscuta campestris TaxID=132261 RepID=A0A484NA22_9ASTE|nr:unnamed protein product [Cuscuta campestris]